MATEDLISAAEAAAAVNDPSANTSKLERAVTAVSKMIDERYGAVVRRTVTAEEVPVNGGTTARLRYWPVFSVTSMVEYEHDGTSRTLTQEDYDTKPTEGFRLRRRPDGTYTSTVERRGGSSASWFPVDGTLLVTYVAGRFADTASVDQRFKMAAVLALKNLWRSEQTGVAETDEGYLVPTSIFPGFSLPKAVDELLRDEFDVDDRFGVA